MEEDVESDTSIAKFDINGHNIYVRILWESGQNALFRIKIFDGTNTWSGRFTSEFAESCRTSLDETEDVFIMNVKKALSDDHDEYVHDFVVLQDDERTARFTWKKVFEDLTVMAHGSVPVHRDDVAESKDTLIDFLLNENRELREVIDVFLKRNDVLTENLEKCKREMEEFVNMKTQLEASLYGKFVQLLNEKKKRILLLEESIQKFE